MEGDQEQEASFVSLTQMMTFYDPMMYQFTNYVESSDLNYKAIITLYLQ